MTMFRVDDKVTVRDTFKYNHIYPKCIGKTGRVTFISITGTFISVLFKEAYFDGGFSYSFFGNEIDIVPDAATHAAQFKEGDRVQLLRPSFKAQEGEILEIDLTPDYGIPRARVLMDGCRFSQIFGLKYLISLKVLAPTMPSKNEPKKYTTEHEQMMAFFKAPAGTWRGRN